MFNRLNAVASVKSLEHSQELLEKRGGEDGYKNVTIWK